MKKIKYLIAIVSILLTQFSYAQNQDAKKILDATASAFNKAGGVTAQFTIKTTVASKEQGQLSGTMQLKGNKFKITTPTTTTWFDGKTQWSYVRDNEEVNISTPSKSEIAKMNPYSFVNIYKSGYSYAMGSTKTLRGHSTHEVVLTANAKGKNANKIIITVDKNTYEPLCIRVKQGKSWNTIIIKSFAKGQKFSDATFKFNKNEYPKAELIDLR